MTVQVEGATVRLTVNGTAHTLTEREGVTLLEALRDRLGLTGAKYGCGEARCGACVVLVRGRPVASCVTTLAEAAGADVTTIEGIAKGDALHPVQQAFVDVGALQCGYCTPGMIVAAVALLDETPRPTRAQIVEALDAHLCRCGAYARIVQAIQLAAERMAKPAA
ncbi:MAG TPA: (2Fe-2S)-binding protein [Chloroflexota bacterium]|nr:(2Fe-2S)-binding protein [Chloroflexota bacterium]